MPVLGYSFQSPSVANAAAVGTYGDADQPCRFALDDLTTYINRSVTVASSTFSGGADYVCDGVNDEVQIQAAIDALGSIGGIVQLSPGTFNISVNASLYGVRVNASHGPVALVGAGQDATVLKLANSQAGNAIPLLITGTSLAAKRTAPTLIRDLTLDGNRTNQAASYSGGSVCQVAYAHHVAFDRVTVQGGKSYGVQLFYDSQEYAFTHCRFYSGTNSALRVESPFGVITDNYFEGNNVTNYILQCAVSEDIGTSYYTQDTVIANNVFNIGANAIELGGNQRVTIANNRIVNMVYSSTYAIRVQPYDIGTHPALDITIIDNTIANVRNGIQLVTLLSQGCQNTKILNNTITTISGGIAMTTGILIDNALHTDTEIRGNTLRGMATVINDSGTRTKISANYGYVTEANGTGTIASGATSAVITHGLAITPGAKNISVIATNNPTNDPGNLWVSSIGATQFTVNCRSDPGSGGLAFAWQAVIV